jgi:hypothetical protein
LGEKGGGAGGCLGTDVFPFDVLNRYPP